MIERPSPELPQGRLRLSFTVDARAGDNESYMIAVSDENGVAVLTAHLPRELVDKIVLAQADVTVALTLSGDVYADLDSIEDHVRVPIAIDELVARAVEPRMIEDEPQADALL
ncbi:MAG: hypothetical protein HC855_00515, partial [Rhizobiales bacterium]|nr:hypothetical protein [Hyphomicrobiales bacterium]